MVVLLRRLGILAVDDQSDRVLQRSCVGRVVSAITFVIIILFLGIWIVAFLYLRDSNLTGTIPQKLFSDLTCMTFFGGIVIVIIVGALVGNFLRRTFWKFLMRRKH